MFNEEEDNDNYFEGNLKEDLERFESFLKNGKIEFLDSDRLVTLIDHYLITSQYSKAKKCAEHALVYFSFNTNLQLKLAQSMGAMGQLKEALGVLSKIEKTEVATFEVILTKASIFSQLRDSKNAIKYFRESLSLCEPEDKDEIYLDLAMEHENLKDYNGALEVLKEAIKNNPKNEGAIYEIAFCYDQLKDYDKAIQCYSDFIDDNPGGRGHRQYMEYRKPNQVLMQFTFLTDSQGKDIYEGDIVLCEGAATGIVVWVFESASFALSATGEKSLDALWWFGEDVEWRKCKIIGNIHQNPELL